MPICFTPVSLGHLTLENRIVRSATNDYFGELDGSIGKRQYEIIRDLAKNEVGLIISAHACISAWGKAGINQNRIYDDKFIAGFAKLAEIVHNEGGRFVVQISHAGGKAPAEANDDKTPRSPSGMTLKDDTQPQVMTLEEISEVKKDFIAAAVRLKTAGVDGVQLHAAHGYLLSEFVDFNQNERTDEYGGSAQNRIRLVREILEGIKKVCGSDFPVLVKINGNTTHKNKRYEEDLAVMLGDLKEAGVDAVELSGTGIAKMKDEKAPYFMKIAASLRKEVGLPIIVVGGVRDMDEIEKALEKGIDCVAMSRAFICEPDLVSRLRRGKKAKCVQCNKCFTLPKTKGKRCVFH